MRVVNVHQAKTHLSRLIDEAHAGETIVLLERMDPGDLESWESGSLLDSSAQGEWPVWMHRLAR